MTKFIKEQFEVSGGYVSYQGKFVLRDKYNKATGSKVTFLIKNFTVEEYFGRLDAGETPLKIMESKGYLLPHIKKWLKAEGLPVTVEGFKMMVERNVEKTMAKYATV